MKLKVITTENTNPYENLAAEEYLTMHAADGELTLFLWQNAHTVVIGRNQNPWRECNVEQIKKDKVYLARRMSGGGAVYHDIGNLNFTFIARDELFDIEKQTDIILLACRMMGIKAAKTGRNDLVVEGRKFSGHAYFSSGGYNYHHGTIMLDVDPEDMAKYLSASEEKLSSKGVASVQSRVVNLKDYLPKMSRKKMIEETKNALIRACEKTYGETAKVKTADGLKVPKKLIEKYSSEEWRLGTKIPFEKSIEHRFEWGEVEVQLAMKGEFIQNCKIYSDALDTDMFGKLENILIGCKYDSKTIGNLERPEGVSARGSEVLRMIAANV